jgi:hypothetical protein
VQQGRRAALGRLGLDDLPLRLQRRTSPAISSSLAPSAAVRMMTPASSGTTFFRIALRRSRSVSGSLRLMPVIEPSGT